MRTDRRGFVGAVIAGTVLGRALGVEKPGWSWLNANVWKVGLPLTEERFIHGLRGLVDSGTFVARIPYGAGPALRRHYSWIQ